jgi:hypothetical protein
VIYYDTFWSLFRQAIDAENSLENGLNCQNIDTLLYLRMRLKYFFMDRYLLPETVVPMNLQCSNLEEFSSEGMSEEEIVKEFRGYFMDNLCIVLSSSADIS